MRKKLLIIFLCLSLGLFAGCGKKETKEETKETGTNVTVYTAGEGDLESVVNYTGNLSACESVTVSPKVNANAVDVRVDEGDYVKAGDVLAVLDKTDIKLAYEQSVAAYENAVAGYNAVVNSSTKQTTAQANAGLSNAQNAYDQAKVNFEREKSLYENNSQVKLAEQNYQDAKENYEREVALYEADASVVSAKNAVDTARDNYERTKQLFDIGGASQLELDSAKKNLETAEGAFASAQSGTEAKKNSAYSAMVGAEENLKTARTNASAAYDNAKANLKSAETALNTARNNVSLANSANKSSVESAEASVNSARASMNIAKNNLNNTEIKAPISGYIATSGLSKGQLAGAGSPAFVIKNTDIIDVEIQVTESVIPFIEIGSPAKIDVASAGVEGYEGAVTLVNPVKNDQTGMYTVKISMENKEGKLNVGMLADIELTTTSLEDVIKVPSEALINKSDKYYIYVVDGRHAVKKEVKTGITDGEYTEITEGLKNKQAVVVEGKEYLSETNNEINITGKFKK